MSKSKSYVWLILPIIYFLDGADEGFYIQTGFHQPIASFLTIEEARVNLIALNASSFRGIATKEWFSGYYNASKEGSLSVLEAGGLESEWGMGTYEANEGIKIFYSKWKIKEDRSMSQEDLDALDDSAIFLLSNLLDIRFFVMSKAKIIC